MTFKTHQHEYHKQSDLYVPYSVPAATIATADAIRFRVPILCVSVLLTLWLVPITSQPD